MLERHLSHWLKCCSDYMDTIWSQEQFRADSKMIRDTFQIHFTFKHNKSPITKELYSTDLSTFLLSLFLIITGKGSSLQTRGHSWSPTTCIANKSPETVLKKKTKKPQSQKGVIWCVIWNRTRVWSNVFHQVPPSSTVFHCVPLCRCSCVKRHTSFQSRAAQGETGRWRANLPSRSLCFSFILSRAHFRLGYRNCSSLEDKENPAVLSSTRTSQLP